MRQKELTNYEKGLLNEKKALDFLEQKGFKLIKNRAKTPYGEIDLLMQDDQTIVAIEVKYRKNIEDAAYSILPKQKLRIQNALLWLIANDVNFHKQTPMQRFDVVLICSKNEIRHYSNAWFAD